MSATTGTMSAYALDDIVHLFHPETVGHGDSRNGLAFQAIGLVAMGTGDMHVGIMVRSIAAVAKAILLGTAAVINLVEQAVVQEKGQGAEQGGFVYRIQFVLQVGQGESIVQLLHGAPHEQADGRRPDSFGLKKRFVCIHGRKINRFRVTGAGFPPVISMPVHR